MAHPHLGLLARAPLCSGPPLLPRAPSWAPWHSRPLLPGFTSATIPGTSVCHSVPDSCLSVSLPHSCPDPRECPFQKLPCPLQCPSLPPAQESAVTAAMPLVNMGLTSNCRPGPHTPSCALSCLGSPSSLLPSGHPPSLAPHRPRGLPTAPPLPTCSQSLQAGVSSSPSHGSSAPLPSRSQGPAD